METINLGIVPDSPPNTPVAPAAWRGVQDIREAEGVHGDASLPMIEFDRNGD